MNTKTTTYQNIRDKSYELKNHLGSVLAVVTDRKLVKPYVNSVFDGFESDVVSYSNYYPFGMEIESLSANSSDYSFGFNGMRKDDEIKGNGNSVNYKYRMHDSRLGRFFAVDPLTSKYPHNSPYAFSENRIIDGIELEGLEYYPINPNAGFGYIAHGFQQLAQETGRLIDKAAGEISAFFAFGSEKAKNIGVVKGSLSNETRTTIKIGTGFENFFTPTSDNNNVSKSPIPFIFSLKTKNKTKLTISGEVNVKKVGVHVKNQTSLDSKTNRVENSTTITIGKGESEIFVKKETVEAKEEVKKTFFGDFIKFGGEVSVGN